MENAAGVPTDVAACCYTDVYKLVCNWTWSLGEEIWERHRKFGASCPCVGHFHIRTWCLGALRLLWETTGVGNFVGEGFYLSFPCLVILDSEYTFLYPHAMLIYFFHFLEWCKMSGHSSLNELSIHRLLPPYYKTAHSCTLVTESFASLPDSPVPSLACTNTSIHWKYTMELLQEAGLLHKSTNPIKDHTTNRN